jgi:hypothetical protein
VLGYAASHLLQRRILMENMLPIRSSIASGRHLQDFLLTLDRAA